MSEVHTYPVADSETASDMYRLSVAGHEVFCHTARVSARPENQPWPGYQRPLDQTELAGFAQWAQEGPATVVVDSQRVPGEAVVRPERHGIAPVIEGSTVSFEIPGPGYYVVEIDDEHNALHLFVDACDQAERSGVTHRFGPGTHDAGLIELQSNDHLHLHAGAVVYGVINARNAENIRITGNGILDASQVTRFQHPNMLFFDHCANVSVEGITLRDPHEWAVKTVQCDQISFENVKLIGCWRYNTDGFDFVDSRGVRVDNCFVRSFDDSIVVKSLEPGSHHVGDVMVRGCTIWTDWGVSLGVTYETRADVIENVAFENCDVLHNISCRGVLTVNPNDRGTVRNVRFEDVRVEDARSGLIDFIIEKSMWSTDAERGQIQDLVVRNVSVIGGSDHTSRIRGYDAKHRVSRVRIDGLTIQENAVHTLDDAGIEVGPHADHVSIEASSDV